MDQSLTVTRQTRRQLQDVGVPEDRILEALGGQEALKLFLQEQPDVTLTELELPDRPGLEVARDILEKSPSATVVLVTAASRDDPRVREALRAGVHGVLRKPVRQRDIRDLFAVLGREDEGLSRIPPPG